MNKKFVLSGLLLSTLLLSPSVFADEVVDTVTTPIVVVEQPIEVPVEESSTPVEAPTEPIEEPTTPVETPIEPIEVPTVPDPVTPIEEPTTPIETPTDPVEEPATPTVPSENQPNLKKQIQFHLLHLLIQLYRNHHNQSILKIHSYQTQVIQS
ncbi:TPA: hypothetical protein U1X30_002286 [Streptococcus suis]|nr:hypothetical protein [Streptococcus suis]HEM5092359.1 hypothetical protein [Streptococcus suis]HEM5140383.1 hypothetical protein [Streptococcus suis]HEM5282814.1 hypothetical protein [Streptococcus suis]